jgi:hypothetical protein
MADHQITLAVRPDERPRFYRDRPALPSDGSLYAVMLRSTPLFPDQERRDSQNIVLVCAQYGRHGWAWINVDTNTRQYLTNAMRWNKAVVDRWHYMDLVREGDLLL